MRQLVLLRGAMGSGKSTWVKNNHLEDFTLSPDYISEKKMKELKEGNCFPNMGCRSFLSPYKDKDGKYKFYGRLTKELLL